MFHRACNLRVSIFQLRVLHQLLFPRQRATCATCSSRDDLAPGDHAQDQSLVDSGMIPASLEPTAANACASVASLTAT